MDTPASYPFRPIVPAPASSEPFKVRSGADRRRYPRFMTEAMYTPMAVRLLDSDHFSLDGHAFDISEGGLRFELDRGIEPGTGVALRIMLPTMTGATPARPGPGRAVFAFANIVWLADEDEPGPVKMAAVFTRFARTGDRERLLAELRTGVYQAAA
ncbi:MAG: PilZ domain-containing protein [Planctomycetaceae bacterium]|jgi:hypothetical protein|nr:PilZ domain-containing protein [Phycisphaerales bacterium]MCE2653758.1 PilZ domain-containing protein [Planctomycetaceae bacterium]